MTLRGANQYSTEFFLASATPSLGIAFGFEASHLRVSNDAGVPIHYSLGSTSAASTGDPELKPGHRLDLAGIVVSGIGIGTTSTTTSTGDDGHRVRVDAWGGF